MVRSSFKYSWFNKKKKDHWHLKHYSNRNLLHSPVQDCAEVCPSFLMKTEILISLRLKWLQDTAAYVHSYYHKEFSEGLKAWTNGTQLQLKRRDRGGSCYLVMEWWQTDFHAFDWEYRSSFSAYVILKFGYHAANYKSLYLFQNSFLLRCPGKPLPTTAFSELALLLGAQECKALPLLFGHKGFINIIWDPQKSETQMSPEYGKISSGYFRDFPAKLLSCSLRSTYKQPLSNYFFILSGIKIKHCSQIY